MKRREFLTGLTCAASTWSFTARAQEKMRLIGWITGGVDAGDPEVDTNKAALLQALEQLGWVDGRNLRIDVRLGGGHADRVRRNVEEMIALNPDVILASGVSVLGPLLQATRTIPVVFLNAADPVGGGFVRSLSRPGGNATGFVQYEYGLTAKWLELLKEIAPAMTRAAVLRDPTITSGIGQFAVIQSVASSAGIEVSPVNLHDVGEIESTIAEFGRGGNGGLIVTSSALTVRHSGLIIGLANRHKLPATYHRRRFATDGGLLSYGSDIVDQYRLAAGYVDRILKGEKPADLPVQAPTKYELVINLKTAKALGLTVPPTLLARADEVIE